MLLAVVLLSLCSAVAYGLSDFVGGLLTRRASVWIVSAVSQATATIVALGVVATNIGDPDSRSLLWGAVAGFGSGAGNVLIYYGLSRGRMAVVAPVSAITTASLPVGVGLIVGEQPGTWPMLGALLALPAVWLVSSSGSAAQASPPSRRRFRLRGQRYGGQVGETHAPSRGRFSEAQLDVMTGLAAGLGFGVQFSALGMVAPSAGLTPLAVSQFVSVATIVVGATARSASWLPRDRFGALGSAAGLMAGIGTVCFMLAVQRGLLTIAGVLASLYPAVTVMLAALVLRERIHRVQGAGLVLAALAVALIASG